MGRSLCFQIGLQYAGELAGLLHDLGKYSSAFQCYLKSVEGLIDQDADTYVDAASLKGKIDHSTAGAQYIWNHLSSRPGLGPYAGQMLALCVASHHSGLIDCISAADATFGEDNFTRRLTKASAKTYLEEVSDAADPEILSRATAYVQTFLAQPSIETLRVRVLDRPDPGGDIESAGRLKGAGQ